MGSSRNWTAGHSWERECAKKLREIGYFDVKTSRECSRQRDAEKVDICNAHEDLNGRLPYNIQCKTLTTTAKYPKLLQELKDFNPGNKQINVVFHRMTKKSAKGRFMTTGEYALLNLEDFYLIIDKLHKLEKSLTKSGVEMGTPINTKIWKYL